MWFGFVFAIAFFVAEIVEVITGLDPNALYPAFVLIVLSGWFYWLFCVHRFHKILGEMTGNRYPITPGEAVGKHIIPFYNLYWMFAWPSTLASHINSCGHVRMASGAVVGVLLLLSLLLRFVDGAVGLAVTFSVGLYISAKLRGHMRSVRGTPAELLPPPPPDPSQFRKNVA